MLSWMQLVKDMESRGFKAEKKNMNLDSDDIKDQIKGVNIIVDADPNKEYPFVVDTMLEYAPTITEAGDALQNAMENSGLRLDFDYSSYLTKDNILKTVRVGFEKRLWSGAITRKSLFKGIDEYCYISGKYKKSDEAWYIDIRQDLLDSLDVTQDEMWNAAYVNTFKSTDCNIQSVQDIFGKQARPLFADNPLKDVYSVSSYSNRGVNGATQILNPEVQSLRKQYFTETDRYVIYPQSDNNFLIGPDIPGVKETLLNIAKNATNYMALTYIVYIVKFDSDGKLKVVAEMPYKMAV